MHVPPERNNENSGCLFDGWRKDFIIFLEWEEKNEECLLKEEKCSSLNIIKKG